MKKIIWLSFLLCTSVFANERCAVGKPECILAITHMGGEQQTLKNFYISSFEQLNDKYSVVILMNNGPEDESGLFVVDENKQHYLTLDYLPSHRGHDYFYTITSYGKNFVVVKGMGGYGYSVDGEVKYEIDFNNRKKDKFKLETVSVDSVFKYGDYLYLNLSGNGLKSKIIQFYEDSDEDKKLLFSFVGLSEDDEKLFEKIKSYTKNETRTFKVDTANITISKNKINNHALPQPNIVKYKEHRKHDDTFEALDLGYVGFGNEIGPYLIENGEVVFGISFYDGEGSTGLGGIGFYDLIKKTYNINYIKEIADKSIGKMFFYKNELWSTLYQGGEGADYHYGVMKYNIDSEKYQVYDIPGKVDVIISWKDFVFVNTSKGFYQINDGLITRGVFNTSSNGDYEFEFLKSKTRTKK